MKRPPANALRITIPQQVPSGLAYLHSRNRSIVHGDIKPENILIGTDGVPRLVGFGLSLTWDDPVSRDLRTSTGCQNTLRYADPVLFDDVTRTDVRALAWIAWELLTNRLEAQNPVGTDGFACERLSTNPLTKPYDRFSAALEALPREVAFKVLRSLLQPGLTESTSQENILLSEQGQPLLADFGTPAVLGEEEAYTPSHHFWRSLRWTSPECLMGESRSCESDLYSFGSLAFTVLTGFSPHAGLTNNQITLTICSKNDPKIEDWSIYPQLQGSVRDLLKECGARLPDARPSIPSIVQRLRGRPKSYEWGIISSLVSPGRFRDCTFRQHSQPSLRSSAIWDAPGSLSSCPLTSTRWDALHIIFLFMLYCFLPPRKPRPSSL